MADKRKRIGISAIFIFVIIITGCATSPPNNNIVTGPDNALLILHRRSVPVGMATSMHININGERRGTLRNGGTIQIVVPNGTHRMQITGGGAFGGREILFTANSNEITFSVGYTAAGFRVGAVITNVVDTTYTQQEENRVSVTAGIDTGIGGAINRVADELIGTLPQRSAIAIVSVSSNNLETASLVVNELEFHLVRSRNFIVVDRTTLDVIRAEQNFQLSGDVSDSSAVSIGQLIGASILITGNISEESANQSLFIRALDVRTGEIVAMAREGF